MPIYNNAQAGIVQRLAADNASVKQSGQLIEQLSLGVYGDNQSNIKKQQSQLRKYTFFIDI